MGDVIQNLTVWGFEILVAAFYGFGLYATHGQTSDSGYVYFLAWKAKKAEAGWRPYWFFKFRYQVARYIRRAGPMAGRDLFVKRYIRGFAEALGEEIPPEDVPGLKDIMRTVHQSGYDLRVLKSEKGASTAIARDVRVLEDFFSTSETPAEAFLRYAARMYLTQSPADRELVRLEGQHGTWKRIADDPIASRILTAAVAGAVVAAVTVVFNHFFG